MTDVLNMSLDDIINKNKTKPGGKLRDREGDGGKRGRDERKNGRKTAKAGTRGEGRTLPIDSLRVVVKNSGVSKAGGSRIGRGQVISCPATALNPTLDRERCQGKVASEIGGFAV